MNMRIIAQLLCNFMLKWIHIHQLTLCWNAREDGERRTCDVGRHRTGNIMISVFSCCAAGDWFLVSCHPQDLMNDNDDDGSDRNLIVPTKSAGNVTPLQQLESVVFAEIDRLSFTKRDFWVVVCVCFLFWGLVCFDMVSDLYGAQGGLMAFYMIVFLCPVAVLVILYVCQLVNECVLERGGSRRLNERMITVATDEQDVS